MKYKDQLFTFLDHDGVSWNNTNAEHFIKPFARYRRTANGVFTARSIEEYLVILSIAETSKGRGEDFFEFLLRDNENSFSFKSVRDGSAKAAAIASSASARMNLGNDGEQPSQSWPSYGGRLLIASIDGPCTANGDHPTPFRNPPR